jgi:tetratricopeptide (TPR) repeat protein
MLLSISRAYQGDNADVLLAEAISLYEAGQYEEAANTYEQLIAAGYTESATLYFNLGNAYFESGQLGKALVNYLRAQRLQPRDGEIERNIVRVRANRVRFQRDETTIIDRMASMTTNSMRVSELAALGLVTWSAFFAFATIYIMRSPRIGYWLQALILLGVVAFLVNTFLFTRLYTENQRPPAVVTRLTARVYSGPDDDYLHLFDLHMATELRVVDQRNNWLKIFLPDGRQGWVGIGTVERV